MNKNLELAIIGIKIAFVLGMALFTIWLLLKPEKKPTATEQVEYQKTRAHEDYALLFYIHNRQLGKHCDIQMLRATELEKVYWNTVKLLFYEKNFG